MHKSSSLLILFFLFSCSFPKKDSSLDYALQRSGDNRRELEKVLEHYRDSGLKYDAARFLIENMPACYGSDCRSLDALRPLYQDYDSDRKSVV